MAEITRDLAKKSGDPPAGSLRGVSGRFPLDNIDGPHGILI